jgi:hypothetical protein
VRIFGLPKRYVGINTACRHPTPLGDTTGPPLQAAYLRPQLLEDGRPMLSIVTTRKCDKETSQVNLKNGAFTRLTATILVVGLVGLASVGCGRHGATAAPSSTGTPQTAQGAGADPAASTVIAAESPSASLAMPEASESASSAPPATGAPSRTPAAANAPDPLDSELQGLDQIVNDVNGSISGTDPGSSGGE